MGKALVLHMTDPGLILGTSDSPSSTTYMSKSRVECDP